MSGTSPSADEARAARGVLLGGLLAGIGDITYAIVVLHFRGRSALWTLQSVASGWFGEGAFEKGAFSGLVGLVTHFSIATTASLVFWLVSKRIGVLRRRPIVAGVLYGILVFLFMNFVVMPLSAYPFHPRYPPAVLLKGFFFHALLVGLPISLSQWAVGGARRPAGPR